MSKVNGENGKILAISITVIFAIVAVVYGYGKLNNRVVTLEKVAQKAEIKSDIAAKKADEAAERVIRVEAGIEYLKKVVDRIERKMDE
jgi:Na+-transporting methylmalonyl-CoA/oxaloacetate decarboxylase gamma subunit